MPIVIVGETVSFAKYADFLFLQTATDCALCLQLAGMRMASEDPGELRRDADRFD